MCNVCQTARQTASFMAQEPVFEGMDGYREPSVSLGLTLQQAPEILGGQFPGLPVANTFPPSPIIAPTVRPSLPPSRPPLVMPIVTQEERLPVVEEASPSVVEVQPTSILIPEQQSQGLAEKAVEAIAQTGMAPTSVGLIDEGGGAGQVALRKPQEKPKKSFFGGISIWEGLLLVGIGIGLFYIIEKS